jgi:zinc transport system permease protein
MKAFRCLLVGLAIVTLIGLEYRYELSSWAGQQVEAGVDSVVQMSRENWGDDGPFSYPFLVRALVGGILAGLICGVISSLVVSNRMAFFSDALAHCAFAGVSLGLILYLVGLLPESSILWMTVLWGVLVAIAIVYVRESTALANDTVIGVFFAAAMGLGAILLKAVSRMNVRGFSAENFLFGDILSIAGRDLVHLSLLFLVMIGFLIWFYNRLVFASFNPSLARSRNFPVRLGNYLFIILLALIINFCLTIVGALLINALLIIPGATAGILARNLRQFFWLSILFALTASILGLFLSNAVTLEMRGRPIDLASGGVIIVIGAAVFVLAIAFAPWIRGSRGVPRSSF